MNTSRSSPGGTVDYYCHLNASWKVDIKKRKFDSVEFCEPARLVTGLKERFVQDLNVTTFCNLLD